LTAAIGAGSPHGRAACRILRFLFGGASMQYIQHLGPVAALIAGVLILIMPKLLNYIIALYLIITGLVGLLGR
jgi:hypothetical protein